MRILIWLVMLVFMTSTPKAESFLETLFKKRTPKVVKKPKHRKTTSKTVPKKEPLKKPPEIPEGFKVVDAQWMADYIEMEAAWGYWIPEDDWIWAANDKYLVPVVVFKHYEDMRNARGPAPYSNTSR